ncbi:MAG: PAS domain S-box protein, partial [Bacteroidota bacterium]
MSKLKQLEKQYPFLKKHKTGSEGLSLEGFPVEQLDLMAILKASQVISENILPEKLNEALIRVVMQQAGAGKGYLLFEYDGRLSVVSEAVSNKEIVVKVHDTPLEPDYKMLPEKIFQFVKRTGSTIIIDDASQDKVFGSDKYIEISQPRSIACLPIIKEGKHLGIIYLENNLIPGAFSADKIAVLKILTSQAAISVENAFYYSQIKKLNKTLEQRVKERTEALKKTQATLQLSEEKYRKIVEETGDAVYSSDYKGYLTYVNPVCKKLTGYAENELVGKHFLEIIAPDWKEKVAKYYKEQFDNKV